MIQLALMTRGDDVMIYFLMCFISPYLKSFISFRVNMNMGLIQLLNIMIFFIWILKL